jgi:hypothetical protein
VIHTEKIGELVANKGGSNKPRRLTVAYTLHLTGGDLLCGFLRGSPLERLELGLGGQNKVG